MEIQDYKYDDNELYHYGILGMKWGRRRYQNSDGSLTPAGQKRYDKAMDKIRTTKKEQKKTEVSKNKPISEMTNEELFAYKQRLQAERDIYNLKSEINRFNPPPETSGKKAIDFVKDFTMNELWGDVAKPTVKKFLDKKIGLEKPLDELSKMKKEAEMWEAKAKIAKNKKLYGDDTEKYENAQRRRDEESKIRKNNKDALNEAEKHAYEEDQSRRKAKEEAYAKAKKQVDDYNTPWEQRAGTYRKKGSDLKWNKDPINRDGSDRLRLEQVERYEATGKDVIGKGTSRYTSRDDGSYVDADYREVVTNYPAVINRGARSYNNVIAMLEDKQFK